MTTYHGTAVSGTPGVQGDTAVSTANGVYGTSTSGASAIYGRSTAGAAAVHGECTSGGWGVYGITDTYAGYGVYGRDASQGGGSYAVYGNSDLGAGVGGEGHTGVSGYSLQADSGVWGSATSGGIGVYGKVPDSGVGYGVYSYGAARVNGDLTVTGAITAGTKDFLIDHPLDPENRLLRHACVESAERKNVYDGDGRADAAGELVVEMPAYVEALNSDFRFQLTPIGAPAPNLHVKKELSRGKFVIAGANPQQKVCWQLTGIRIDALARANPLVVESDKPEAEKGYYEHPEAHGQSLEKSAELLRRPLRMRPAPPPASMPLRPDM